MGWGGRYNTGIVSIHGFHICERGGGGGPWNSQIVKLKSVEE